MFSYIGRYKTITYIGQYKPTSLKSFQYYIYRSIYADKRHISIHICNISWFKLGAYIGPIYIRSYNDRYIKTYILPKYVNIYRSISKLSYIDRYMTANIDRYMKIFKNHFSIDICRKGPPVYLRKFCWTQIECLRLRFWVTWLRCKIFFLKIRFLKLVHSSLKIDGFGVKK